MSTDSDEERRLLAKLAESATTPMEKKNVLDARDKLLRLRQQRQTDLATAVAVVGTCPDMCPEHERYFRIETNQVAVFEMSDDDERVPDERRMVKEYRRSGADQQEPLPHELRPIEVLERTMTYLCLHVIDLYNTHSNTGEWFDFVWSRTRSIRKDITQQHMVNLQSVALIEKCARFHIFCAYYLCEEEMKDFDPKINEENLSNCLQTLKDFYYDLSLRSITCPNEAEFRAYDIVLNLPNGETLSELKHFRMNIKNSPEVKFAVKIYQAYHSKNSVRFFRFCRQASFFMSCILNRYLNAFRVDLLNTMRNAFTIPKSSNQVPYPVSDLITHFAFDDFDDLCSFCERIGLDYDSENIYFRRSVPLDNTFIKRRSKILVVNKLTTTPGRCIIGDANHLTIQSPILPVHSSFDNNNCLIFDSSSFQISNETRSTSEKRNLISRDVKPEPVTDLFGFAKTTLNKNSFFPKTTREESGISSSTTFSFKTQTDKIKSLFSDIAPVVNKNTLFKPPSFGGSFVKPPESTDTFNSFTFNLQNQTVTEGGGGFFKQSILPDAREEKPPSVPSIDMSVLVNKLKISLFDQMIEDVILEQCKENLLNLFLYREVAKKESIGIWDSSLNMLIREIARETLDDCKRKLVSRVSVIALDECIEQVIGETIHGIHADIRLQHLVGSFALFTFEQLFDSALHMVAEEALSQAICHRDQLIRQWRCHMLQRKFWLRWRHFYLSRRKYKFYRDTIPAAPLTTPGDSPSSSSHPNGHRLSLGQHVTLIDDNYIQSSKALKRKLAYSKFKDTSEIKRYVNEQLAQSRPVNLSPVDLVKREYYLESKYFKLWLHWVCRRKANSIRASFPAAPLSDASSNYRPPRALSRFTIIDPEYQEASSALHTKLAHRLNYDFDSTVQLIRRTLAQCEERRQTALAASTKNSLASSSCSPRASNSISPSSTNSVTYQPDGHLEPLPKRFMTQRLFPSPNFSPP